jgi:integrase
MALTDLKIRNAKPRKRRYRLADANNLSIEITPKGGRYWRYRYRLNGKENLFAGGEWCRAPVEEATEKAEERRQRGKLTLAEARMAREQWRADVKAGLHPRAARRGRALIVAATRAETFDAVAAEFIDKRCKGWSDQHRKRLERFLERDVSPDIGPLPVRMIRASHLLPLLQKVEDRDALSMAALGRSYLSQIFRYAVSANKADFDPTASLKGALQKRETKHHEPLSRSEIAPFFKALGKSGANPETELAIRLLAYMFPRTIELRCAPWPEFELKRAEWRLPATRMKMRRPHIVPLSDQAVELLKRLQALTGKRHWLFPNVRRPATCMGATTINRVIERMGFLDRFTAHGFRATASTLLHEAGFDSRLIEMQLAHQDRNKSRASYDHSARLPERRQMMQSWADMLDEMMKPNSNVVSIRHRTA